VSDGEKDLDVEKETGINRNTVTLLYNETAQRIDLEAIDKLWSCLSVKLGI
jgi:putative transcriptional regulator